MNFSGSCPQKLYEWQLGKHSLLIKPETIADVITAFWQLPVKMNFYLLLCREDYCVSFGTFKQLYLGTIVVEEMNYSQVWPIGCMTCRITSLIISCSNENEYFLCSPSFYLTLNVYIFYLINKNWRKYIYLNWLVEISKVCVYLYILSLYVHNISFMWNHYISFVCYSCIYGCICIWL